MSRSGPTRRRGERATPASLSRDRSRSMPRSAPTAKGVEAILSHFQGAVITLRRAVAESCGRRVPGAVRGVGRDRSLDRRGRQPRASVTGRLPGASGYERDAAGPPGRRGAGRGDVRREGRLLRQRRRAAAVLPRPPCLRARARCRTSTCSPSCCTVRAARSARARFWPSWPRPFRRLPSPAGELSRRWGSAGFIGVGRRSSPRRGLHRFVVRAPGSGPLALRRWIGIPRLVR